MRVYLPVQLQAAAVAVSGMARSGRETHYLVRCPIGYWIGDAKDVREMDKGTATVAAIAKPDGTLEWGSGESPEELAGREHPMCSTVVKTFFCGRQFEEMKTTYRGFEIEVTRGPSMTGDVMLFYGVFRASDQWEADSGFYTGAESVREYVGILKDRVDNELADPENRWHKKRKGNASK